MLGQTVRLCLGAAAFLAAGVLLDAGDVDPARRLSLGVQAEVEDELEVGVEHEEGLVVGADGLPLPVGKVALVSGILRFLTSFKFYLEKLVLLLFMAVGEAKARQLYWTHGLWVIIAGD